MLNLKNVDTSVYLDQRRFTQVISSVLLNSLYYAQEQSIITIEANIKDGDELISNYSSSLCKHNIMSQQPEHSLIVQFIVPGWYISNYERINLFKPIKIDQISEETE